MGLVTNNLQFKIWGFHGGDYEVCNVAANSSTQVIINTAEPILSRKVIALSS
jgi:hypothetical protein